MYNTCWILQQKYHHLPSVKDLRSGQQTSPWNVLGQATWHIPFLHVFHDGGLTFLPNVLERCIFGDRVFRGGCDPKCWRKVEREAENKEQCCFCCKLVKLASFLHFISVKNTKRFQLFLRDIRSYVCPNRKNSVNIPSFLGGCTVYQYLCSPHLSVIADFTQPQCNLCIHMYVRNKIRIHAHCEYTVYILYILKFLQYNSNISKYTPHFRLSSIS